MPISASLTSSAVSSCELALLQHTALPPPSIAPVAFRLFSCLPEPSHLWASEQPVPYPERLCAFPFPGTSSSCP